MKQSTRRITVAQKRIQQNKDVLRRPLTFHKSEVWFMYWWQTTPDNMHEWFWYVEKLLWKVALTGPLPSSRRLTKPLVVDVEWLEKHWIVTESLYSSFGIGLTLHKAMEDFRHGLVDDLDSLSKEGYLAQHLQDQLVYLREMIEDIPA